MKTIRGSHHVYMKPERRERIIVPVHSNKDLKLGLLKAAEVMELEEATLLEIMEMLGFEFSYLEERDYRSRKERVIEGCL